MTPPGSVSRWILALKNGDQAAAQPLWERYHARLIGLAWQSLRGCPCRQADEEDVVQNAFHNFFQGVSLGRFPQLDDRDNLWHLLVALTIRKAIDQARRAKNHAAGVGKNASGAISLIEDDEEAFLEQLVSQEPTPELAAQMAEQCECLLGRLEDERLRQIAVWKLEGNTNAEVAVRLSCSQRTVERKLATIRLIWSREPEAGRL
jgi:RNA polymerase sigma factor (sigma-70 family)